MIAVRRTTRVSDLAAHAFTRAFYLALVVGSTIRAAYDIGVQAVVSAPNVPSSEREASNFLLLPADASHDAVVLPALPGVDAWQPPPPRAPRLQQPLPLQAEAFLGRNVETYRVVSAILDRRLVTVAGRAGVGKSAVAVAALNYLSSRLYFPDGVLYADLSHCETATELANAVRAAVFPHKAAQEAAAAAAAALAAAAAPSASIDDDARSEASHASTAASSAVEREDDVAAAVAPLRTLHCLLVLDGVSRPLLTAEPLKAALEALLNFARVRTLLTAPTPVAQPLQGGSEKVIALEPLSAHNTARLLCRLSPRTLLLSEIAGATSASNFVQKLSLHPLVEKMHGNPGVVKATAPRLQGLKVDELQAQLENERTSAGLD